MDITNQPSSRSLVNVFIVLVFLVIKPFTWKYHVQVLYFGIHFSV